MLKKLIDRGIPDELLYQISTRITFSRGKYKDEFIDFETGVPQGAVLSPVLFNLYIDDLIVKLNEHGEALAFADDIVIVTEGLLNMDRTIKIIDKWSHENLIKVNKSKSAIMGIRNDRRTPFRLKMNTKDIQCWKSTNI